jgi:hypothetical protein
MATIGHSQFGQGFPVPLSSYIAAPQQRHALLKQVELPAVHGFKSAFPRMHCDKSIHASAVLVVARAQRQDFQMRAGLCAPVNVVDADYGLDDPVEPAGYAAKSGNLIVQALFCCAWVTAFHKSYPLHSRSTLSWSERFSILLLMDESTPAARASFAIFVWRCFLTSKILHMTHFPPLTYLCAKWPLAQGFDGQ